MKTSVWKQTMLGLGLGLGVMVPAAAMAMGLGPLRVLSAPGEPFTASISIIAHGSSVKDTDAKMKQLSAHIASGATFKMAGITKNSELDQWKVRVDQNGSPHIIISSPLPIVKDKIPFILEVSWPGGQMNREYVGSAPSDSISPVTPVINPVEVVQHSTPYTAPQNTTHSGLLYHGWSAVNEYGPVPLGASLFSIVNMINRLDSITPYQAMLALVHNNPSAFNKGNPSIMYAGKYLSIPGVNVVQSVSPEQAQDWFNQANSAPALVRNSGLAHSVEPHTAPAITSHAVPKNKTLKPVKTKPKRTPVHKVADSSGRATHLVLSSAPPALTAKKVTPPTAAVKPTADSSVAAKTASPAPILSQQAAINANLKEHTRALQKEVLALGEQSANISKTIVAQNASILAITNAIISEKQTNEYILAASATGNILLLALLVWMLRRRKSEKETDIYENNTAHIPTYQKNHSDADVFSGDITAGEEDRADAQPPESPNGNTLVRPTDKPVKESPVAVAATVSAEPAPVSESYTAVVDYTPPKDVPQHEEDPLEQAELYMVYGKEKQAVETLKGAINSHPDHVELYTALLDVYVRTDNTEDYLELAQTIRDHFGRQSKAWHDVALRGAEMFPTNKLFIGEETAHPNRIISDDSHSVEELSLEDAYAEFSVSTEKQESAESTTDPENVESHLGYTLTDMQKADDNIDSDKGVEVDTPKNDSHELSLSPRGDNNLVSGDSADDSSENVKVSEPATQDGRNEWDELGTKLDLAKAYVEMGDPDSARDLIEEIIRDGDESQKIEAQSIKDSL